MTRFPLVSTLLLLLVAGTILPVDLHAAPGPAGMRAEGARTAALPPDSSNTPAPDRVSPRRGPAPPPPSSERWRDLWREMTAPALLLGSMGPAVNDHRANTPSSWRGDAIGYGFRVGSHTGRLLLEAGAAHGLAAATRLNLRFRPRGTGDIGSRLRYAALEAVTARTPGGLRVPNAPRVVGSYGAALAQQRWQFGAVRPGDAARTAALGLGVDIVVNVVLEFTGGS